MSMESSANLVDYQLAGNIARIELRRPPVNALSLELIQAVVAAFRRAAADPEARAVLLSSALAKRFSAGLDLDIVRGKAGTHLRPFLQSLYIDLFDAQYQLGKPSIAVVGGAARGGGMTVAVSCDIILASDNASFGYPEIDVGMLPAIHYAHLPRIVGRHRAFELLFTGRVFSPAEACELGIVNRVVADDELESQATALATQFAAKSPTVMAMGRAAFMRQIDLDYRRSIATAVDDFCNVTATPAAQEGIKAFIEKRQPKR